MKRKETKTLDEAIEIILKDKKEKFDSTVSIDIVLNLKESQKKETIKGRVLFPNNFGDEKKIIVICKDENIKESISKGAFKAGNENLIKELESGFSDFDILITETSMMPKLVKLGKILGPKGLMPNPKNGTVTDNVVGAIENFKSGMVNFKSAQGQSVIRLKVGKTSMTKGQIIENIKAVIKEVLVETKKLSQNPIKKVTISSTMGTGIKLDINDIISSI